MRKAVFQRVIRQTFRYFVIGMPAAFGIGAGLAAPCAEMHLIDIQRLLKTARTAAHPLPVGEARVVNLHDNGRIVGSALSHLRVWVRLVADCAAGLPYSVFVELTSDRFGNKDRVHS